MRLFIGITYGAPAINPLSARSNRFRHALTHPSPCTTVLRLAVSPHIGLSPVYLNACAMNLLRDRFLSNLHFDSYYVNLLPKATYLSGPVHEK